VISWLVLFVPFNTPNGKNLGPTDHGIDDLIHATSDGLNKAQDYMCSTCWPDGEGKACDNTPFLITGGSNNAHNLTTDIYPGGTSDSIANVVL
jgi:hypothetical protein